MPKVNSIPQLYRDWTVQDKEALQAIVQKNELIQRWLYTLEANVADSIVGASLDFDATPTALAMERGYNAGRVQVVTDVLAMAGLNK